MDVCNHPPLHFYTGIKNRTAIPAGGCLVCKLDHLKKALERIADKEAWRDKYPQGNYECIAVESIGIAREALKEIKPSESQPPDLIVLPLRPNDTLAITFPGPISYEQASRMKEALGLILPGVKCLIIGDDPKLSVLRPEAADGQEG